MFKNYDSLDNFDKITVLAFVSIFLIYFCRGLYYGMSFLSVIIVIVCVFIYMGCFWWLFKKKENKKVKLTLEATFLLFIAAIMFYSSIFLFGS